MERKSVKEYIIILLSIAVVAGLGSLFVNLGMDWFNTLLKPSNFVPNVVIPIVWSVIYIAFAIILCISDLPRKNLVLLLLNGAFNIIWCLLFFTFNNTLLGLIAIILNLILAYALVLNILKQNKLYGYILSIYPIWVSIATCLNLALWILN